MARVHSVDDVIANLNSAVAWSKGYFPSVETVPNQSNKIHVLKNIVETYFKFVAQTHDVLAAKQRDGELGGAALAPRLNSVDVVDLLNFFKTNLEIPPGVTDAAGIIPVVKDVVLTLRSAFDDKKKLSRDSPELSMSAPMKLFAANASATCSLGASALQKLAALVSTRWLASYPAPSALSVYGDNYTISIVAHDVYPAVPNAPSVPSLSVLPVSGVNAFAASLVAAGVPQRDRVSPLDSLTKLAAAYNDIASFDLKSAAEAGIDRGVVKWNRANPQGKQIAIIKTLTDRWQKNATAGKQPRALTFPTVAKKTQPRVPRELAVRDLLAGLQDQLDELFTRAEAAMGWTPPSNLVLLTDEEFRDVIGLVGEYHTFAAEAHRQLAQQTIAIEALREASAAMAQRVASGAPVFGQTLAQLDDEFQRAATLVKNMSATFDGLLKACRDNLDAKMTDAAGVQPAVLALRDAVAKAQLERDAAVRELAEHKSRSAAELAVKLATKDAERLGVENRLAGLDAEHKRQKDFLAQNESVKVAELKNKLDMAARDASLAKTEIARLSKQLDESKSNAPLKQAMRESAELQAKTIKTDFELDAAKRRLGELESENKTLTERVREYARERDDAMEHTFIIAEDNAEAERARRAVAAELAETREDKATLEVYLEAALADAVAERDGLRVTVAELTSDRDDLAARTAGETAALRVDLGAALAEAAAANAAVEALTRSSAELALELTQARADLEAANFNAVSDAAVIDQRLVDALAELANIKALFQQAGAELQNAEVLMRAHGSEKDEMGDQITTLGDSLTITSATIDALTAECDRYKEEIVELKRINSRLERKVNAAEADIANLRIEIGRGSRVLDELNDSLEAEQKRSAELQAIVDKKTATIQDAKDAVTSLVTKTAVAEISAEDAAAENVALRAQLDKARGEIAELQDEVKLLSDINELIGEPGIGAGAGRGADASTQTAPQGIAGASARDRSRSPLRGGTDSPLALPAGATRRAVVVAAAPVEDEYAREEEIRNHLFGQFSAKLAETKRDLEEAVAAKETAERRYAEVARELENTTEVMKVESLAAFRRAIATAGVTVKEGISVGFDEMSSMMEKFVNKAVSGSSSSVATVKRIIKLIDDPKITNPEHLTADVLRRAFVLRRSRRLMGSGPEVEDAAPPAKSPMKRVSQAPAAQRPKPSKKK